MESFLKKSEERFEDMISVEIMVYFSEEIIPAGLIAQNVDTNNCRCSKNSLFCLFQFYNKYVQN